MMFRIPLTPLLILNLLACPVTCAGEVIGTGACGGAEQISPCESGCCAANLVASRAASAAGLPALGPGSLRNSAPEGMPRSPDRSGCECPCLCQGAVVDQQSTKLHEGPGGLKPVLYDTNAFCVTAASLRFHGLRFGLDVGQPISSGRSLCVTLRALLL